MRFASAFCLATAMALLPAPWYVLDTKRLFPDYVSGLDCTSDFGPASAESELFFWTILFLRVQYPLLILVGVCLALAMTPSRRRAAVVGTFAVLAVSDLSALYLFAILLDPLALQRLSAWFYLSHASCLTTLIICVVEYRRAVNYINGSGSGNAGLSGRTRNRP